MRRAKIVISDNTIEHANIFKYLGCNISLQKIKVDFEGNFKIPLYNKLKGQACIKRCFGKNMRN
jgi:hypothetical protein